MSGIAVIVTSFATAGIFALEPTVIVGLFTVINLLRIVNLLRIAEGRMNDKYLWSVTRKTSAMLGLAQIATLTVWAGMHIWVVTMEFWVGLLAVLQIITAVVLFSGSIRRIQRTKIGFPEESVPSEDLPSVTIAIPARNETDDLEECLHSVLGLDYPKLEILVLDDCSQLKRTPAIIRDFAHAGVRFLKGEAPDNTWQAKNYAYHQLAKAANGEIILFCGVDIRFDSNSLKQLVQGMVLKNKRMMSVLPLRHEPHMLQSSITQAARYVWEMSPPRKLFKRPAVLSSCWLIYRQDLIDQGSFAAVRRAIVPEALFARGAVRSNDSYSFVRSTESLGVWSSKTTAAQRQTAVRVRYPSLHRRPEVVLLLSLFNLVILFGSFVMFWLGIFDGLPGYATVLSGISALLFTASYTAIAVVTKVNSWFIAPLLIVPAIINDVLLMYRSMWLYEFSEVLWKGRNVCLPVMRVIPTLPKT